MSDRKVGTVSMTPGRRSSSRRRASARTHALSRRSMPSPNSTASAVSPAGSTLYLGMTGFPTKIGGEDRVVAAVQLPCIAGLHGQGDMAHGVASTGRNHGFTLM